MSVATNGSVPILEVNDLVKNFIVKSVQGIRTLKETVQAVSGVSFMVKPGQTLGSGGGVGFGQVHRWSLRAALAPADLGIGEVQGHGAHRDGRRRPPTSAPRDADRVPGSVRVARPSYDGRFRDQRAARHSQGGGEPQGRRGSVARAGWVGPRSCEALPARVLRRSAPTHRRRPRARARPRADRARRAGLGARRLESRPASSTC